MNLNRRGYLAVEVILASVVAITISIFLMEITVKIVNVTDDAYVDTELLTDKALIIKNIKFLLEEDNSRDNGGGIKLINCSNNRCDLSFCHGINRYIAVQENTISYGDSDNNVVLYSKKIDDKIISDITLNTSVGQNEYTVISDASYLLFKISAPSKFSNNDFTANIIIYNDKTC